MEPRKNKKIVLLIDVHISREHSRFFSVKISYKKPRQIVFKNPIHCI